MGYEAAAQKQILRMFELFEPHVFDRQLHVDSAAIIADHARWGEAKGQFSQVRQRLLKADKKANDQRASCHLAFLAESLRRSSTRAVRSHHLIRSLPFLWNRWRFISLQRSDCRYLTSSKPAAIPDCRSRSFERC